MVLAVALFCILIKYRLDASQERTTKALDDLSVARETVDEIKGLAGVDPSVREEQFRDASTLLDSVMSNLGSSDPRVGAETLVARGDLNWSMATLALATTQPSASGQTANDYTKAAESAWQQVLSAYPQQDFSVCAARMGLAAAAENRSDWDQAGKFYQSILDDTQASPVMQQMAKKLLVTLNTLEQPIIIAPGPASTSGGPATRSSGQWRYL